MQTAFAQTAEATQHPGAPELKLQLGLLLPAFLLAKTQLLTAQGQQETTSPVALLPVIRGTLRDLLNLL
jgi:hypothetical protein